jgi:hypothetical protein
MILFSWRPGKVTVERPRVRDLAGQELSLPSWDRAVTEDWLGKWAMNLMLINVSTRKFRRAVLVHACNFVIVSARPRDAAPGSQ